MSISWERWQEMRASLDYCSTRMRELSALETPEHRPEYEALVEHAIETANRIIDFSGHYTPPLSTGKLRLRWQVGRSEAMALRERFVKEQTEQSERYQLAEDDSGSRRE